MPNTKPFPSKESAYNIYVNEVVPYLLAEAARLNVDAAQQAALPGLLSHWNTAYDKTSVPVMRTQIDVAKKNIAKGALTGLLREVYANLPKTRLTTIDRSTFDIPLRARRTRAKAPDSMPLILNISTAYSLQQKIFFKDADSPTSRARPKGMMGCEIWCFIGSADQQMVDVKEYRYVALAKTTPHTVHFEGADAGKTAFYMLRWISTRGEHGPWSATKWATIVG